MKVRISQQVLGFIRSLPPDARHKLRLALKGLSKGQENILHLEGTLAVYSRLRIAGYRVIIFYRDANQIECVFAEHRSIIYEIFAEELRTRLSGKSENA